MKNLSKKNKPNLDDVVKVTCYNQTKEYVRREAIAFFFECIMNSEGSEQERYVNIYQMLMLGYMECWDC